MHGLLEQGFARVVERTVLADGSAGHASVGERGIRSETVLLALASRDDLLANVG